MTVDRVFSESDIDNGHTRLEFLGYTVNEENGHIFERLVRNTIISGVVDVTGWTCNAIRILLSVCCEKKLTITLKNGKRYSTVIKFPQDQLFETLVNSIHKQ